MKTLISSKWSKRILWLSIITTFSICTYIVLFIGTANTKHDDICLYVCLTSLLLLLVRYFLMEYWHISMPPVPQELKKLMNVLKKHKELHVVKLLKENDLISDKHFLRRFTVEDEVILALCPPWTEKWTVQIRDFKNGSFRVYDSDGLKYKDSCKSEEQISCIDTDTNSELDVVLQNIRNFIDEPKEFPAKYSSDELVKVRVSFSLHGKTVVTHHTKIPMSSIIRITDSAYLRVRFKNDTVFYAKVDSDVEDLYRLPQTKEYEGFELDAFYIKPQHIKTFPNMKIY